MVPTESGRQGPSNPDKPDPIENGHWKTMKSNFKLMHKHECIDYEKFIQQNKWAVNSCSTFNSEEKFHINPYHFSTYQSSRRSGCYKRIVVEEYCPHTTDFLEQLMAEQEKMRLAILKIKELEYSTKTSKAKFDKLRQIKIIGTKLVPWW